MGLRSTFLSQHRKYKVWVNRKYNRSTCEPTWAPLKSYSRAWGLGSLHRRGSLLKHWMVEETFADLYTTCFSYGWRFLVDLKRDCTTWIQSSHTTASHHFYFTAASHHFHKSLKTGRFYFTAASHYFHFTAAFPVFKDLWKWWEAAASHHFHKSLKTRRFYFTAASHHFHFTAAFPVFKDLWKWREAAVKWK